MKRSVFSSARRAARRPADNAASEENSAFELRQVGVQRQGRWILRDINWRVPSGSCCAIVGPNGSGKSTLARLLCGQLWPTTGELRLWGAPRGDLEPLRRQVRLVQAGGPLEVDGELSCRQVILSGFFGTLALYDRPSPPMRRRADELLEQVGLFAMAGQTYATLSNGERLRCLLARALAQRPRLLLLDEPTAGLDLPGRERVLATIQRLAGQADAPCILLITHHLEELPPAVKHVLLLRAGGAIAAGAIDHVLTSRHLSDAYGCRVQIHQRHGRRYLSVHPRAWQQMLTNPR